MRKWLTTLDPLFYTLPFCWPYCCFPLTRWLELRFIDQLRPLNSHIGSIAILFTALGIWLALKLSFPKINTVVVERESISARPPAFTINEKELEKTGLSSRELEVLQLMAEGIEQPGDRCKVVCVAEHH